MMAENEIPLRRRLVDMSVGETLEFDKKRHEYISSMIYRLQNVLTRRYSLRNRKDEPKLYVKRIS